MADCPLGEDCDLTLAYMMGAEKAKDTIKVLRAENTKLRAALEKIANTTVSSWIGDIHGDTQDEWRDRLDDAITIARAALGGENDCRLQD